MSERGRAGALLGPPTASDDPVLRLKAARVRKDEHVTTRALLPLDDADHATILEVLDDAFAAATTGVTDASAWGAVNETGHRPATGYKLARRTWAAGQIASHALRLAADPGTPWGAALHGVAAAINSADWDERTYATLALRKTFKDLPEPVGPDVVAARRVAAWLRLDGGPQLPAATVRLCRTAQEQASAELGRAWYATHGRDLLRVLAERGPLLQGKATAAERARRDDLRLATLAVHDADPTLTKSALANAAGITRITLNSWLAAAGS